MLYRRENSRRGNARSTSAAGTTARRRAPTNLAFAVDFAAGWYLGGPDDRLARRGIPLPGPNQRLEADVVPASSSAREEKAKEGQERRRATSRPQRAAMSSSASTAYSPKASGTPSRWRRRSGRWRPTSALPSREDVDEVDAGLIQEYRVTASARRRTRPSCAAREA